MDIEVDDLEHVHLIESEALKSFSGLIMDYYLRMGEAMVHALANWIHEEDADDVLSDIKFYRDRVLVLIDDDVHRERRPKPS